ncbi:MAG: diaminopimelate epimerase [Planctomycetes bacterium]|nr:diaminopimelate epimerase [Planctomycetota bacterium]
MDALPFVKVEAGGNDFVVLDARAGPLPAPAADLARDLCRRRRSIGADGLVVLEAGPTLVHLEPDGARTFCLNAVRAVAALVAAPALATDAGRLEVRVAHDGAGVRATVALPPPRRLEPRRAAPPGAPAFEGTFADVGNPQFVVAVDAATLEHPDLLRWGRALRWHEAAFPGGTNVCFAARRPDGRVALRTYERGVEDETLSCGTGAVATACALALPGEREVRLVTRGGDEQRVTLARAGGRLTRVWADGPARVVARGALERHGTARAA